MTSAQGGWTCHGCGKKHEEPPLSYGVPLPDALLDIPQSQWKRRLKVVDDEVCILDKKHFYIRGNIEIPLKGRREVFGYTVWASLSKTNFERAIVRWGDRGRTKEPPYFSWVSNNLPGYPPTLNLAARIHTREPGVRPFIELEPTDHPLAVEQKMGIDMRRVREIAESNLHPDLGEEKPTRPKRP